MPEIDYFFTPQSPWTYLGHARFVELVKRYGVRVHLKPCDLTRVFAVSGGLPLAQRAPQRQSYRLVELRRFSEFLDIPINLSPRYFPVQTDPAAHLILAALEHAENLQVLGLAGALGQAVWHEERDISDPATLATLAQECGFPGAALLELSQTKRIHERYLALTDEAIEGEIFGAPTYVFSKERFWGQDRLDFLERALARWPS